MAKKVTFALPQTVEVDDSVVSYLTRDEYLSKSLLNMDQQHNSQDSVSQNQTGSTIDSREDHDTQLSSPSVSVPRGFSSDEGSGWRSETETSDGNFSLSQYPLDDRSGDESNHGNGNDEALSSIITEVSKDFISGNFSPMKCPSASGESDSSSDGDHKSVEAKGAVYANYPESATGLSDCDWNPYESDNNDIKTPRSAASDGHVGNPLLDTMSTAHANRQMKDSGYGSTYKDHKTCDTGSSSGDGLDRNNSGRPKQRQSPQTDSGDDKQNAAKQNKDLIEPVPLMTTQQFYALYSTNHQNVSDHDEGSVTTKPREPPQGASGQNELNADKYKQASEVRRESGEYVPAQNGHYQSSGMTNNEKEPVLVLRNGSGAETKRKRSLDSEETRRAVESLHSLQSELSGGSMQNIPRREAGSATQSVSERSMKTNGSSETTYKSSGSSADNARQTSSDNSQLSSRSRNTEYMSIQERERLLGVPPGSLAKENLRHSPYEKMARELMDEAESEVKSSGAEYNGSQLPSKHIEERKKLPESEKFMSSHLPVNDQLSQGDRLSASPSLEDPLSKRVTKLLEDANTLGASLHKQLYSREALGLEGDGNYQLYTPNKSADDTPNSLSLSSKGSPHVDKKFQNVNDSLEGVGQQRKSLSSLNDNLSRSGKSEQSIASSLGEEVAKLMAKSDISDGDISKMDGNSKPYTADVDSLSHTAEMESLQRYYAQQRETDRLLEETKARLSSGSNTDDPLGLRVQNILKETAHVETLKTPDPVSSLPSQNSGLPSSLDYIRLQKDLQEIQNSLSQQDDYPDVKLPTQRLLDKSPMLDTSLRSDRSGDTDIESARNRKLIWDHGADFGIDNSGTGAFIGTMKTDYTQSTENEQTISPHHVVISDKENDGGYISDTQEDKTLKDSKPADVVGDQLNSENEDNDYRSSFAPDVEEIIQRYQKNNKQEVKAKQENDDDPSGLASRVFHILTKEPPQKQVFGILESAMEQEREMMHRIAIQPKLDSTFDSYGSPDGSFVVRDKDIKKQLEWSGMSSMDAGHDGHPDKTNGSDLSFLRNGKHAPFSSLGNAKNFLSSQLQKNTDRTFNHSIELRTPCRNVIDCYPVYGVEKDPEGGTAPRKEPDGTKEAWPDNRRVPQSSARPEVSDEDQRRPRTPERSTTNQALGDMVTPRIASSTPSCVCSDQFFLTDLDNTPIVGQQEYQRRHSDPRDLSPDFRITSPERDRHSRSRSEEAASLTRDRMVDLEPVSSNTSRRSSSSPRGEEYSRKSQRRDGDRQETYGGNSPVRRKKRRDRDRRRYAYREHSPTNNSGSVISPNDTDSSSSRSKGTSRLRPYRPYGSRELYYTESPEDSGSIVDSITTVESSHTGGNSTMESTHSDYRFPSRSNLDYVYGYNDRSYGHDYDDGIRYDYYSRGSDDAVPPTFPSQYLGSRTEIPKSSGIYSDKHPKSDGLSTIEEKSVITDDRSGTDSTSGMDRKSDAESLSSKGDTLDTVRGPSDRRPDSGLDMDGTRGRGYAPRQERLPDNLQYAGHADQGKSDKLETIPDQLEDRPATYQNRYNSASSRYDTYKDRPITNLDKPGSALSRVNATLERHEAITRESRLGERVPPGGMSERDSYMVDRLATGGSSDKDFSATTRSDPGDHYATPLKISHDSDEASSDHRSSYHYGQGSRDTSFDHVGPIRSRSKSETDLIEVSLEEHKNSSPVYGKPKHRPMDLSCQPSPIFSHHTTMDSPAVRGTSDYVRGTSDNTDRHFTERMMQRPLERGTDYDNDALVWKTGKPAVDYSRELPVTRPQGQDAQLIGDRYKSTGRITPEYRSRPDYRSEPTQFSENPRYTEDLGVKSSASYCDKTGKPVYESSVGHSEASSIPRSTSDELQNNRPGSGLDELYSTERPHSNLDELYSTERPRSNLDEPYSNKVRDNTNLEPYRPLEPGPGLIARPLEPGPGLQSIAKEPMREIFRDQTLDSRPGRNIISDASKLDRDTDIFVQRPRPQSLSTYELSSAEEGRFTELVPDVEFEDAVLQEREKLAKQKREELLRQVQAKARSSNGRIVSAAEEAEFGAELDRIPPSRKAQVLRQSLEKEYRGTLHPDINEMWQRFQDNHHTYSDSSMDTPRIETLSQLMQNPTKHVVQKYMDDRTYERVKEKQLLDELVKVDKENERVAQEMQKKVQERRRRESDSRQQLSEEEINGSYGEILARNERRKSEMDKKKKEKDNRNTGRSKVPIPRAENSTDTLFSIPEDTSFEAPTTTPNSTRDSEMLLKAKHSRQRHVIDPLMRKLKDKVQRQRDKIEKDRRKELKRMDKLKKLEMLLGAKKKGKLSDKAIDVELDMVTSTSTVVTDSSTLMDTESTSSLESGLSGYDHTTMETTSSKDSSTEKVISSPVKYHIPSPTKYRTNSTVEQRQKPKLSDFTYEDTENDDSSIFQKPQKKSNDKMKHSKHQVDKKSIGKKLRNKENVERFLAQIDHGTYSEEPFLSQKSGMKSASDHRKTRTVGTMYPSPIQTTPPNRRKKSKKVYMVSEAVQTSPYVTPHSDRGVIPVPLMSPEARRKRTKSPSACSSPARSRSNSRSPTRSSFRIPNGSFRSPSASPSRTVSFNISNSPVRTRSTEGKRRQKSPLRQKSSEEAAYEIKTVPPPKSRMFTPETPDDNCIAKLKPDSPRGVCWYIPMAESRPWRKPLREQQAFAVANEPWQPKAVHPADWKAMMRSDVLSKDVSRDTKFVLDPKGQNVEPLETSDEENVDPLSKPLSKLSLQDAFQAYKQSTISRLRERQKRLELASQERQLQNYLEHERKEIFSKTGSKKDPNPEAHPYSENLHKPKRRVISKEEMKTLTQKLYKKLPEVVAMKNIKKRDEDYSLNRLKARVFNRKIQKHVLHKT